MELVKLLKLESSKQGIWFTSDTHFGHKNILKYCGRPWNSTEEMDEDLITNWNKTVGKDDLVFHLGDFAFAPNSRWKEILNTLNGKIHLILGNHDRSRYPGDKIMELFSGVYNQLSLTIDDVHVILNHYPFLCFAGSYKNPPTIQLFGHVHSSPLNTGLDTDRLQHLFPTQYDVGVDNNNYTPVSWQKVLEIINERNAK